ncbi:hypothetical protein [Caenimonas sedimenti]|uniref:hypothetical protein n=1 Tax=Caenimonas sedimenti TaxID=2596921 RepID=UPI0016475379|nr:hypothetical protein [Caenimonas sedimenti]
MPVAAPARNLLLSVHVLASVGWAGALAVFLAHALAGLWSDDPRTAAALGLAMGVTAWVVILPLAVASFATGVAQSLLSVWGILRHHWVVFKLALTAVATAVLLVKLGPISALAQSSAASGPGMEGLRTSLALHAAGGLAILVAATLLAVYKPVGLTKYGARKLGRERVVPPAWVKAAWVVGAALAVALGAMLLLGNHGPSAHLHG